MASLLVAVVDDDDVVVTDDVVVVVFLASMDFPLSVVVAVTLLIVPLFESFVVLAAGTCLGGDMDLATSLGGLLGVLQQMVQILMLGSLTKVQNSHSHS